MYVPAPTRSYFLKIRSEAKRRNVEFLLTEDDIAKLLAANPWCPITDEPLFNTKGQGGGKNTPNIVRLLPHKGFTVDNVVVLSMKARTMRQDASPAQLRRLADLIEHAEVADRKASARVRLPGLGSPRLTRQQVRHSSA